MSVRLSRLPPWLVSLRNFYLLPITIKNANPFIPLDGIGRRNRNVSFISRENSSVFRGIPTRSSTGAFSPRAGRNCTGELYGLLSIAIKNGGKMVARERLL